MEFLQVLPFAILIFGLFILFAIFKSRATELSSIDDFENQIAAGKPTYLRFFKNT